MNNSVLTPLRYPGGKSLFTNFFSSFIRANEIENAVYIEPYCGGSGAAINLLLSNKVSQVWLNDANYSIYSFWYCLKYYGEEFLQKLDRTEISLDEWRIQRAIFKSINGNSADKDDLLANGFATFYLNRCNRSGILNAGPIGGQGETGQNGLYKIDARFNKKALREKLTNIIANRDRMYVYNMDALVFLQKFDFEQTSTLHRRTVVYLDPPYYKQGSSLYLNFYKHKDHAIIADFLSANREWRWLLSYDNVEAIRTLYGSFPQYSFYLNYSAQGAKLGNELLIHSNNSILPESLLIKQIASTNKKIELVAI